MKLLRIPQLIHRPSKLLVHLAHKLRLQLLCRRKHLLRNFLYTPLITFIAEFVELFLMLFTVVKFHWKLIRRRPFTFLGNCALTLSATYLVLLMVVGEFVQVLTSLLPSV